MGTITPPHVLERFRRIFNSIEDYTDRQPLTGDEDKLTAKLAKFIESVEPIDPEERTAWNEWYERQMRSDDTSCAISKRLSL